MWRFQSTSCLLIHLPFCLPRHQSSLATKTHFLLSSHLCPHHPVFSFSHFFKVPSSPIQLYSLLNYQLAVSVLPMLRIVRCWQCDLSRNQWTATPVKNLCLLLHLQLSTTPLCICGVSNAFFIRSRILWMMNIFISFVFFNPVYITKCFFLLVVFAAVSLTVDFCKNFSGFPLCHQFYWRNSSEPTA